MNLNVAILLNGPPGVGKDTLADILCKDPQFLKMEYKEGLRQATISHFHIHEFAEYALNLFADRELKEVSSDLFDGLTPREALIHVDTVLKEKHGKSMVGEWAAKAVQDEIQFNEKNNLVFVFSDSGFEEEARQVAEMVDLTIVVRLRHNDFNFDNDSRDYVTIESDNILCLDFWVTRNEKMDDQVVAHGDANYIKSMCADKVWEHIRTIK